MIEHERFNRTLVLSFFFSFFIFMLSYLLSIGSANISGLLVGTFLESFVSMVDIFRLFFVKYIYLISRVFFIGCLIALISIFIMDYVIGVTKEKNTRY